MYQQIVGFFSVRGLSFSQNRIPRLSDDFFNPARRFHYLAGSFNHFLTLFNLLRFSRVFCCCFDALTQIIITLSFQFSTHSAVELNLLSEAKVDCEASAQTLSK